MSVIAVMVNCALIGMSDLADRLFPGWGTAERMVFIITLEVFCSYCNALVCVCVCVILSHPIFTLTPFDVEYLNLVQQAIVRRGVF